MASPIHALPEISGPSMAGKEETHNEANRLLEQGANWFLFKSRTTTAQPGSPADGDCYLLPASATGTDWAGQDGKIAQRISSAWVFLTAREGMAGYVADENAGITYDGAAWGVIGAGAGASTTQTDEMIGGFIASPSDKDYKIVVKMAHGGTITETTTVSASGTCTATFKVNTTALGGTANSVSSTEQSQAHASSNTFVAGDDIVITISSNTSCADMSFSIKYTRTLA